MDQRNEMERETPRTTPSSVSPPGQRRVVAASPPVYEPPLDRLQGLITPTAFFFLRNHGPTPIIDAKTWRLRVEGTAVERPREYSFDDVEPLPGPPSQRGASRSPPVDGGGFRGACHTLSKRRVALAGLFSGFLVMSACQAPAALGPTPVSTQPAIVTAAASPQQVPTAPAATHTGAAPPTTAPAASPTATARAAPTVAPTATAAPPAAAASPTPTVVIPPAPTATQRPPTPTPLPASTATPTTAPPVPTVPPTAPSDQAVQGRAIFLQRCARCHGQRGEGVVAPALIGPGVTLAGAGNAQELFVFASTYMPADAPGTLKEDEYWAVLAFLLQQNGLYRGDQPLGRDNAAGVSLRR